MHLYIHLYKTKTQQIPDLLGFCPNHLCPEQDSNLHILGTLVPETSASTNSAIRAFPKERIKNLSQAVFTAIVFGAQDKTRTCTS